MLKFARGILLISYIVFGFCLNAQVRPCPSGSMADVIGTSCGVGPMIFNFGTDFQGSFFTESFGGNIAPANIGFIPVQSGNQAGFKLILNFAEAPSINTSDHFVSFTYTPQAASGHEIRVQSTSMDAHVQSTSTTTEFVNAFDFQFYPVSSFLDNEAEIDIQQGIVTDNVLSQSQILEVPAFLSTGSGFPGFSTTQVGSFASAGGFASLASATFMYTTGPDTPIPSLAILNYKNIDLPGVAATFVSNITNSGRLVGTYQDFAGFFHGYMEDEGRFTTIDAPEATATFASGLNEHGDVTGSFLGADGHSHGFLQHDGAITIFNVPGAIFTSPVSINNKGQIVGEYQSADRGFHGFILEDGIFTTIDEGPGTGRFSDSAAFGINNSGEIGGTFFDPNTFRSYLLKNNSVTVIDVPGQGDTTTEAINNSGDVVGIFNDVNLAQHGFLFSHGIFRTVDFPDGNTTFALGTNDSGAIVGSYTGPDGNIHSFLATPGLDDGQDHRPAATSASSKSNPDCRDEEWHRKRAQLRNTGACQVK